MRRYNDLETRTSEEDRVYRSNPIYPEIKPTADDLYIISTVGDRYDTLAQKFYSDSRLWWIIASANNFNNASLIVEPGLQIRIPSDKLKAIEAYHELNENR